ncbi:multiprotein-bridging factor 1a-like isoform X2 [Zingiber officinale]|nr:multiprotein-bridging factor 1a-like isoform X2 [Zingiber officinale]
MNSATSCELPKLALPARLRVADGEGRIGIRTSTLTARGHPMTEKSEEDHPRRLSLSSVLLKKGEGVPSVGFLPKETLPSGLLVSLFKTLTSEGGIVDRFRSGVGGGAIAMSGTGPISQDWEPIVLRKKSPTAAAKKDEKAVNAARRSGAEIETIKKYDAGTNRASSSSKPLNTRKLDEETENLSHEHVSSELKKNLMRARLDKKLTQSQLAQLINEKPQVIQEYESGKAIPNQQIITKLERVLGVKLRGKK